MTRGLGDAPARGPGLNSLPFLVYLGLALLVTYPFILDPASRLIAPSWGDVMSSIAKFDLLARERMSPLLGGTLESIGYPDGVPIRPGVDRVSFLSSLTLWLGSLAIGSVATHGFYTILGFFLTASVTFLFVRRVTNFAPAAFVAGLAYGFFPHLYTLSRAAPTYTHMWLFILPLWAFWLLARELTPRRALIAGVSVLPAIFWTPYYALHCLVISASFLGVVVVRALLTQRAKLAALKIAGLVLLPWAVALCIYWFLGSLTSFAEAPQRPLSDAYEQAALPFMYVLPGAFSWGGIVYEPVLEAFPEMMDINLYVGYSVLILAAAGIGSILRERRTLGSLAAGPGLAGVLACAAVVASFLCSLPPTVTIGAAEIQMPGKVIFSVAPGFRAGQRFVMPLTGGLAVLAGLGCNLILRRIREDRRPIATFLISLIVVLDLWTKAHPVTDIPQFSALATLRHMPKGAVADFMMGEGFHISRFACFLQPQHGHPVVSRCELAPATHHRAAQAALPPCTLLHHLRADGVRYVITDDTARDVSACFAEGLAGPWRLVAADETIEVFDLID